MGQYVYYIHISSLLLVVEMILFLRLDEDCALKQIIDLSK